MANATIGYIPCPECGERALVTMSKTGKACIRCEDGCFQTFMRSKVATDRVLARMQKVSETPGDNAQANDEVVNDEQQGHENSREAGAAGASSESGGRKRRWLRS